MAKALLKSLRQSVVGILVPRIIRSSAAANFAYIAFQNSSLTKLIPSKLMNELTKMQSRLPSESDFGCSLADVYVDYLYRTVVNFVEMLETRSA